MLVFTSYGDACALHETPIGKVVHACFLSTHVAIHVQLFLNMVDIILCRLWTITSNCEHGNVQNIDVIAQFHY